MLRLPRLSRCNVQMTSKEYYIACCYGVWLSNQTEFSCKRSKECTACPACIRATSHSWMPSPNLEWSPAQLSQTWTIIMSIPRHSNLTVPSRTYDLSCVWVSFSWPVATQRKSDQHRLDTSLIQNIETRHDLTRPDINPNPKKRSMHMNVKTWPIPTDVLN